MPKLTIALWLLYLMISLGVRLIIQVRMTGSSGFVLHRRRASPLQMFASALFACSSRVTRSARSRCSINSSLFEIDELM
jgi:hypothetical protein